MRHQTPAIQRICEALTIAAVLSGTPVRAAEHPSIARDSGSLSCLTCHDGSVGRDASGHPIDVDYDAASRQLGARLRPISALPAAIKLDGGRVGCATCHDVASSLPARLSMSNTGSALCFACHDL